VGDLRQGVAQISRTRSARAPSRVAAALSPARAMISANPGSRSTVTVARQRRHAQLLAASSSSVWLQWRPPSVKTSTRTM
jgi:hypothetical protein